MGLMSGLGLISGCVFDSQLKSQPLANGGQGAANDAANSRPIDLGTAQSVPQAGVLKSLWAHHLALDLNDQEYAEVLNIERALDQIHESRYPLVLKQSQLSKESSELSEKVAVAEVQIPLISENLNQLRAKYDKMADALSEVSRKLVVKQAELGQLGQAVAEKKQAIAAAEASGAGSGGAAGGESGVLEKLRAELAALQVSQTAVATECVNLKQTERAGQDQLAETLSQIRASEQSLAEFTQKKRAWTETLSNHSTELLSLAQPVEQSQGEFSRTLSSVEIYGAVFSRFSDNKAVRAGTSEASLSAGAATPVTGVAPPVTGQIQLKIPASLSDSNFVLSTQTEEFSVEAGTLDLMGKSAKSVDRTQFRVSIRELVRKHTEVKSTWCFRLKKDLIEGFQYPGEVTDCQAPPVQATDWIRARLLQESFVIGSVGIAAADGRFEVARD